MFGAYLYRIRKTIAKKPWVIVVAVLAILYGFMMLSIAYLNETTDMGEERDPVFIAGFTVFAAIAVFDLVLVSGIKSGVSGFSFADVNFHLAGPFSPRFNLFIAAINSMKMVLLTLWLMMSQVGVISMTLHTGFRDIMLMFLIILSVVLVGFYAGSFIGAKLQDRSHNPVYAVLVGIHLIFIIPVALNFNSYGIDLSGGFGSSFRQIISKVFSTDLFSAFPVAGWFSTLFKAFNFDPSYVWIYPASFAACIIALIILYYKGKLDYYEESIEMAQKVNDLKEAKKAGIDTDQARLNAKIKVGKEVFCKGWGANVFFHRHLFENIRTSKLFFLNSRALLYRAITFFYMMIISRVDALKTESSDSIMTLFSSMTMTMLLNAMVYGGGKTIFEFNRPYIFMVPEKSSKKILNCVLAEIPEMIFDSVLCGLLLCYFTKWELPVFIGVLLFFVVYDLFSELMALCFLRIFSGLGQYTMMIVRYVGIFVIAIPLIVPGIVVAIVCENLALFFLVSTGVMAAADVLLAFLSGNIIDKMEMN